MHDDLATVLNNHEWPAIEVGGTSDHVHALFRLSKSSSLAAIVEEIKTSSSKWVKTQGKALVNFHWQSGYGGFSVSPADVEKVAEYIARQETHHRAVTFQEEYKQLLRIYGIEFDERYVWDRRHPVFRPFRAAGRNWPWVDPGRCPGLG
jgi:hypothetical protein